MAIATINPATGELIKSFDPLDDAQLDERLQRASEAAGRYRLTTVSERADWLVAAAQALEADAPEVAKLMATEMGKTLKSAEAEALKCAKGLRYYAEHGPEFLADQPVVAKAVGAERAYVTHQPLGVVLAIMPWNFPLWQAMRFAAPALMAGNVGLLKHASNVPQTALYLEELFLKAGFPPGVFQTLLIGSDRIEAVLRDARVAAATLTGSEAAGRAVAAVAGEALKKTVLELGGSDPFVVMPSADLPRAAEVAAIARCQNNGQSCIAAKRFIVHQDVAEEFGELFAGQLAKLKLGDPVDPETTLGPLATEQGRKDVEELVADAVAKGARVVLGGTTPDGPGWYYPATLITDITPEMRMHREEVFGPVASLYTVANLDAAIALANDSSFGLGSNIWTTDEGESDRFVRDIEAGMVFVNGMTTSYPELPFGGIKASGYGRELTVIGMREFQNIKSVWIG